MIMNSSAYLHFDGARTFIEVPSRPDLSLATTGALCVAAWIRPSVLLFPNTEGTHGSRYVHWLGKGEKNEQEWSFRMYSQDTQDGRGNRISFYVFNSDGRLGVGSYFQAALQPGDWIHVVGMADNQNTYIYHNGVQADSDLYAAQISPTAGGAPLRVGTRDFNSFFEGEIREVRVWNRVLSDAEISALYGSNTVSVNGLVAEFLLTQDVAPDSAGDHAGVITAPTWISQET
jgi:hypothetical protein